MSKNTVLVVYVDVSYSTRGMILYPYYSEMGLPRCPEVGFIQQLYIISTTVRSVYPTVY